MLNLVKKTVKILWGDSFELHGLKFSNLEVETYFCCVQKIRILFFDKFFFLTYDEINKLMISIAIILGKN
jgi:hypothetical protein